MTSATHLRIVFLPALFLAVFLPSLISGKRIAPAAVEPVIHEGVRYFVPNDDGRRAYIEAWDVRTNKKLWDLTVFTNRIDPELEEDIQWVFISQLSFRDGTLIVTSERGRTYQIDLRTKAITQSKAAWSAVPDATAHSPDIREVINRAIASQPLAKKYELSHRINPFYLRGDFNGDGKIDIAALVKQQSTGKVGIAIIHGATDKVTVLAAGTAIGNGGDDFEWVDSWEIYSRDRMDSGTSVAKLRGDALVVSKSEAASALIYWNGKRYVWLQQGD
ncbi:MAG TPA: hypothetical protein VFH87_06310 [Candidatus Udaeobacter sp.]|nr:hypothetical protein [Candidatus Udaeobacter sp.]